MTKNNNDINDTINIYDFDGVPEVGAYPLALAHCTGITMEEPTAWRADNTNIDILHDTLCKCLRETWAAILIAAYVDLHRG